MRKTAAAAAILAVACAAACRRGGRVASGDSVTLHYELSVDGAVRESTFGGDPVEIVQGRGDVPPGVDAALLGTAPGEERTLTLTPVDGFGKRDASLVRTMPMKSFGDLAPAIKPGKKVSGFRNGKAEVGIVLSTGAAGAVVDFNPPLAGKSVGYRFRVVSSRP
ncbi:MAG: FKBP-type peptidyl-prolyl cis-trans isomerase [Elusimicrobia bacterium]|nr:FKBP-type peptidyl-prolyl cis-trans isomerase [Elusimicrobiota bacterium]